MVLFIASLVIFALAVLALKLYIAQAPAKASGVVERPILTDNEREFFHRLSRALPDFHVFPQVAANALLQVDGSIERRQRHRTRNRFAQKHVDYVICERESLRIVALIELDDRTHRAEKDKARDALFAQAGYITHRFESRRKPSDTEIAMLFAPPRLPSQDENQF